MLSIQGGMRNPLKEYILSLKDQSREGTFFKMLKQNKAIFEESLKSENPVEKYIKGFAEKRLFEKDLKGNFLNYLA